MKKLLLLTLAAGLSSTSFAQSAKASMDVESASAYNISQHFSKGLVAGRTTAVGDTMAFTNMDFSTGADTVTTYFSSFDAIYDSGFVFGMNYKSDKAFAERYKVVGTDSTISVLGVIARFDGNYNPATTRSVDFKVWKQGAKTTWIRPTLFNSGFPEATALTSKTVSIKDLGIGVGGTSVGDTTKQFWFTTPTAYLTNNFFIGYEVNYTWGTSPALNGDTIGLKSNLNGERHTSGYTVSGTDTTINNQNVTMYADGTWHDNLQENFGVFNHLYIFPIVKIGNRSNLGASSITNNGFTFSGCFPNPAGNNTSVRFSLASSADVMVEVMDASGKTVISAKESALAAGAHQLNLDVASLPSGQYVCLVRTSTGDGIATQMVVAK